MQMMCRVLEVAVSGYYDWLKQPISNHDQEDARLLRLIRASFVPSHGISARCTGIATRPNTAWVTDITYIRTWQGWLCLAVVMDLFSRRIVGWAAGPTIHRELGPPPLRRPGWVLLRRALHRPSSSASSSRGRRA